MKFTVEAKHFSGAMTAVQKIVERRNTIPILSNAVVTARDDGVELRSTDLDIAITLTVPAQVSEPGSTTVPAQLLSEILRKMASGAEVTFTSEKDGQMATVAAGRSRFQLQTLPESDYPDISTGEFTHTLEFIGDELSDSLAKVSFAISSEETRYYLNGVFWNCDAQHPGCITFVATDGHRLAKSFREVAGTDGFPGIIVPRKAVSEITNLAKAAGKNPITIEASDTKIRVTAGSTVLVSKLIDGTFPDYNRVIPALTNMIATMDAKTLSAAADRVSTVSSERGRAVKLTFGTGNLKLDVSSPDNGSGSDELDIDYDGAPVEIGFNVRYLADICGQVTGNARISLTDAGSPTIIMSEKDDGALFVIMPMRV